MQYVGNSCSLVEIPVKQFVSTKKRTHGNVHSKSCLEQQVGLKVDEPRITTKKKRSNSDGLAINANKAMKRYGTVRNPFYLYGTQWVI